MEAASTQGLDVAAFRTALYSRDAVQAIAEDTKTALGCGLGSVMPCLFVNERWAPRWRLERHDILGAIVAEAASQGLPPPVPERRRR
jgi:predicted DsbA family dithiol-disulfide isomerase